MVNRCQMRAGKIKVGVRTTPWSTVAFDCSFFSCASARFTESSSLWSLSSASAWSRNVGGRSVLIQFEPSTRRFERGCDCDDLEAMVSSKFVREWIREVSQCIPRGRELPQQ